MGPTIRLISAEATLAVRHPVLRTGLPRETAILPGDGDPETHHFGAFTDGGTLVGVASIYPATLPETPECDRAWQLRGMATMPEVRGGGYGRALLLHSASIARQLGGELLWCNARTRAVPFYQHHGWRVLGEEFDVPTVGPHFRMSLSLRSL